jgi:hypothetical protein
LSAVSAAVKAAVPPSDTLLPATTKGYVSVAQPEEMKDRWNKTQLGQMMTDEIMRPFADDLRKQLNDKFGLVSEKLGITWDDLDAVPAGELSLSLIERKGRPAALAITIDVTGHKVMADKLLAAVEKRFAGRGGRKTTADAGGTTLTLFTIPGKGANAAPQETVYFVKDELLCGVDDRAEAEAMLKRFAGTAKDNLRSVAAYVATMERCRKEAKGLAPELRWYAEPFGFIYAARTLQKTPRNPHDKDYAKIFQTQGFDAIQGLGGTINLLAEGNVEILHRTAIHAPPVPGKDKDPLRWNLGMRIMQLPNTPRQEPPSWAPRMSATYSTINIDPLIVFDNVGTLFDAIQGRSDVWKTSIDSFLTDPYGAKIDLRKEAIEKMGKRVIVVTDYKTPITVGSERSLFAIEAQNEKDLAAALAKWMKAEGSGVKRRELGEIVIWERMPPEAKDEDLQLYNPVFGGPPAGGGEKPKDGNDREPVLPNSAVCVALGHLMIASDIEYLNEILAGFAKRERLATSDDFQQIVEAMNRVTPGETSAWGFARMDEEVRPMYELIRQGKMPQSNSLLGRLLNDLLTTDIERQEKVVRKQRIDGSTLPNFEAVRRYFGTAGRALHSDPDGWVLSGAVLNKEAP